MGSCKFYATCGSQWSDHHSRDLSKFTGNLITTLNIAKDGLWEVRLDGISVGGRRVNTGAITGIIDTGTSLLLAPPALADAIHRMILGSQTDGRGSFIVPCSTTIAISLAIGGTQFSIDPRDYVGAPLDGRNLYCVSNISGQQIGGPAQFLVGDVFLKNVYTVFDVDNQEIGFGTKNAFLGA